MIDLTLLKWLAALVAVIASVAAAPLLRANPRLRSWTLGAMGFLPFAGLQHFSLNLVYADEFYRGDSTGLEVTAIDFLMLALWLALPKRSPGPYRIARLLYLAAVLVPLSFAPVPVLSMFSLWKLLRMYAVVTVVARACEDPEAPPMLIRGFGLGVILQALYTLDEHYRLHEYQATGAFEHQNTLGMACSLIAPIALAIALSAPRRRMAWAAAAAASLAILLSLSRGSLIALILGFTIVFFISCIRSFTARKVRLAAGALVAGAAVALRVWATWSDRFLHAPKASAEGRQLFEQAAALMLADHPFGLGINQFSWALEHLGYSGRAGITGYDAGAVVHNIYWLTAVELGWAGLLAYLFLIAAPLWTALHHSVRAPENPRGDVLAGCAAGLAATYAQGLLEWLSRQSAFAYLFWMVVALIAALARQLDEAEPAPAARVVVVVVD